MKIYTAMVYLYLALWLLNGLTVWAGREDENPYVRRILAAKRLSASPKIDGDISDAVWQEATVGEGFTDDRTNQLVADQTRFWLSYDNVAIYLAAYCWDSQPDKLVMQETKRDGAIWNDDNIEFSIDPFHTHSWQDSYRFQVNPRSTQASRMGGGRSGKTEWKGDWQAAVKVVKDGWTLEMAIPWAILNYPNNKEAVIMGFNVRRRRAREQIGSWFSNLTQQWRNEYAADWVGVELPAGGFKSELLLLPFIAGGAAEQEETWKRTIRGGMDVRYRPTPTLTSVLTFNPDFQNIQSEVEGIDFSRSERWVGETRPFFQEGNDMFQLGSEAASYFYSRRIQNVDAGTKIYGKVAKRTNLGLLSTYDFNNQLEDDHRIQRQDYVTKLSQGIGDWG